MSKNKGLNAFKKASKLINKISLDKKEKNADGLIAEMKQFNDGKFYAIIKEGGDYVIKVSNKKLPTQTYDFGLIAGSANNSRYVKSNLNEAKKFFNLMYIQSQETHILNETLDEKKYVLKVDAPKKKESPEQELGSTEEIPLDDESDGLEDELPDDLGDDMSDDVSDESDSTEDFSDFEEDDTEEDPKLYIQKLSGKLAYKIGEYEDEDYSDTAKYAVNMLLSRISPEKMEENDIDDIVKKVQDELDNGQENVDDVSSEEPNPENGLGESVIETLNESVNISEKKIYGKVFKSMLREFIEEFENVIDEYEVEDSDLDVNNIKSWADKLAVKYNKGLLNIDLDNIIAEFLIFKGVQITDKERSYLETQVEIVEDEGGVTGKGILTIVSKYIDGLDVDLEEPIEEFLDNGDFSYEEEQPKAYKKDEGFIESILNGEISKFKTYFEKVLKYYDLNTSIVDSLDTEKAIALYIMGSVSTEESEDLFDFIANKNDFKASNLESVIKDLEKHEIEESGDSKEDDLLFDMNEDYEEYKESGGKIKNALNLDELKSKVEEYSQLDDKNKNYELNIIKFFDEVNPILRTLDHDLSYNIDRVPKYDGVDTQDIFIKGVEETFKDLNKVEQSLEKIYKYKYNYWMKRNKKEGRDSMALELVEMINKRYQDFMEAKQYYLSEIKDTGVEINLSNTIDEEADEDGLLFDLSTDILGELEEDSHPYTEKPKAPKNKKYVTDFFGTEIGRIDGDDDAVSEKSGFDFKKKNKRNPFDY